MSCRQCTVRHQIMQVILIFVLFSAEASLKFWRVSGSLSADVQKSMEEADKHINVEVSIFYQGQLGEVMKKTEGSPDSIPSGSAAAVLGEVKSWADKFESHACTHDFAYG